jgi:hypothetical protein
MHVPMPQASTGAGTDTRRVGPFTVEPQAARRLLMSQVEAEERQRATAEIARLTGAQQVRSGALGQLRGGVLCVHACVVECLTGGS